MLKERKKIIWKACICVILCLSILFSNMSVANASDLVTDSDMSFHAQNDLQLKKISSLVQYEISSGIQVEKLDENDRNSDSSTACNRSDRNFHDKLCGGEYIRTD